MRLQQRLFDFISNYCSFVTETPNSPVNETGIGSLGPLESNGHGRSCPPEISDEVECVPIVHQDHVPVAPATQATAPNQRTPNKKRPSKGWITNRVLDANVTRRI